MPTSLLLRDHLAHAPATRLLVALWGGLVVIDLLRDASDLTRTAGVVALVAACCRGAAVSTAVSVAGIAALLLNGFVVHDLGELAWTGSGDLARGGVLLVVALVASRRTGQVVR